MVSVAALMVAFGAWFWIYDDEEWTRKQDQEGKAMEEWERENQTYEDFITRLDSLSGEALRKGDMSAVKAYEDSICKYATAQDFSSEEGCIEILRLDSLLAASLRRGGGETVADYCDSICSQAIAMGPPMPEQRYVGFPLGGLVSVFVFMLAVLPFVVGVILLVVYYSKRSTYKGYLRNSVPPPPPPASI